MAQRSLPIFDFDNADNHSGAVKSFYGSAKRSASSPGHSSNPKSKRTKRTVLEDMIFNGKIPPTVLTAMARENNDRFLQKG